MMEERGIMTTGDERSDEYCAYCGGSENLTRDHIPPKALFPAPRPHDLLTVPACSRCNSSFEKDDEYFRVYCSTVHTGASDPAGRRAFDVVLRSLARPEAKGLAKEITRAFRLVEMRTEAGLILGKRPVVRIDSGRVQRVADRIMQALYVHHTGFRIPDSHYPKAIVVDFQSTPERRSATEGLAGHLLSADLNTFAEGAFTYRIRVCDDDPNTAACWFTIFREVHFLGGVVPHPLDDCL